MPVTGGRAIYGETVGILVLDTRFPRIAGDVGNATTFGFPVRYRMVEAATPGAIVTAAERARALLPAFVDGARALEREGVRAITTTCGFLTVFQAELAAAVRVPVLTSSLFLVPLVRTMLGGRPVGVVTAHSGSLSPAHLAAAGIDPAWPVPVAGMEDSPAFVEAILRNGGDAVVPTLEVDRVTDEVVAVCRRLVETSPDVGALVFECTNLPPYAHAVQAALGLPIYSIVHLVELLHAGAVAPAYRGHL